MTQETEIKSKKILKGAAAISHYCGFSKSIFADVLAEGLPAVLWKGTWWAYADNLDEHFKRFTMRRMNRRPTVEELKEEKWSLEAAKQGLLQTRMDTG